MNSESYLVMQVTQFVYHFMRYATVMLVIWKALILDVAVDIAFAIWRGHNAIVEKVCNNE